MRNEPGEGGIRSKPSVPLSTHHWNEFENAEMSKDYDDSTGIPSLPVRLRASDSPTSLAAERDMGLLTSI